MAFMQEFKEFAVKGNVIDLAVGVVIGTAFGKIVSSLVTDIIMPPIGFLTGGIDFADKMIVLKEGVGTTTPVAINYGMFINSVIDFVIIALAIFFVIKQINRFKRGEGKAPTNKECPFCKSSIHLEATRCPNCTSELTQAK